MSLDLPRSGSVHTAHSHIAACCWAADLSQLHYPAVYTDIWFAAAGRSAKSSLLQLSHATNHKNKVSVNVNVYPHVKIILGSWFLLWFEDVSR